MDRELLEALLLAADDKAPSTALTALAALRDGASYVVWEGTSSAGALARVYARRLGHTRRKGIETTGLERVVTLLGHHDQHGHRVRLGQIRSADGTWTYMLFITEDSDRLVACTGVRRPTA
ncbi:hypothetical protein AB0N81_02815 [Streptomyces sp. NPDC093510]|uniref:hypothetical protein n=1 Tax=Streptomyces sp. NPDC093510 TaxID=3155199 RepID=UPI00343C6B58